MVNHYFYGAVRENTPFLQRKQTLHMTYNFKKPLRVVTLCSGYDSQCMALERLKRNHSNFDYDLVAWSEIDKNAIAAHNLVFPKYADRNLGDMTKIDWSKVPDFDFLTYSTPCQDFSNAGLQKGGEEGSGTRSSILWYTRNAIIAKKPKYMMLENVKALISNKFKPLFLKWCSELESYGYANFWKVINAKDYGIPQNRERVFLISIRNDVLRDSTYHFPKPFALEKRIKDILEPEVDDRYYLSEKALEYFKNINERKDT